MTKVEIKYDSAKDVENFVKGSTSVNSKEPTKLQEEYLRIYPDITDSNQVSNFLEKKGKSVDFHALASEIEHSWKKIEPEFIKRCEKMFGLSIPENVIGYLSLNQRCTYNWRENYFFIYTESKYPLKTIMHELLHFYTHRKYDSREIENKKFNDIKESLTVLLNYDFKDLMGGTVDGGYNQHCEMRNRILEMRKNGKSIDEIFKALSS